MLFSGEISVSVMAQDTGPQLPLIRRRQPDLEAAGSAIAVLAEPKHCLKAGECKAANAQVC